MAGARKSRRPTSDELDLFGRVLKDAKPIESERHAEHAIAPDPVPNPPPEKPQILQEPAGHTRAATPPPPQSVPDIVPSDLQDHAHGAAPGVDRRLQLRLKRGQVPIEARIDLHGLTREKAHVALNGFLARQEALGRRCVLVITGKGRRPDWQHTGQDRPWGGDEREIGVIRRALPGWLGEYPNKERILAFTPAQPQDGGKGAWYVLLRRRRARARGGRDET
ncbi:MAG: Smr/MutS family protein [Thalassobaculaceae bacterium]|nr:Smr/MutS family protein [Thalassobaculaceae bacterium]